MRAEIYIKMVSSHFLEVKLKSNKTAIFLLKCKIEYSVFLFEVHNSYWFKEMRMY